MRDFLASLFFGGSCFVCRGAARAMLCAPCRDTLPLLGGALCPRCALPTPSGAVCGRCLAEPPAFDATIAAMTYEFPADALVHALKFRGELALAPLLGALLRTRVSGLSVDRVVPVPLSTERLRRRGYNQAAEIARHVVAEKLDLDACTRPREGTPQVELPLDERRRNVRGAFLCRRPLEGSAVAVVDDVMTSGATLDELARTLKRAGAARVVNWVVARTLPPS